MARYERGTRALYEAKRAERSLPKLALEAITKGLVIEFAKSAICVKEPTSECPGVASQRQRHFA